MSPLNVLSVTPEFYPLVKTGGLADVTGALPGALAPLGIDMRTLMPAYRGIRAKVGETEELHAFAELMGGSARLLAATLEPGTRLLLLDAPHLYDRPGGPYLDEHGRDWPDNARRFAALSLVAAEIGQGLLGDWRPAVVHGHDWQAGLAPAYLALNRPSRPRTVHTIHNLAFQGIFPAWMLNELRLPIGAFATDGFEYYGQIGFLKAAIFYADRVTSVSPTYAREICYPELGMGLDGILRAKAGGTLGIVNGIDTDVWNPATDRFLAKTFDAEHLDDRAENKRALRERLGLDQDASPLLCVISRLSGQKGLDLLLQILPRLIEQGAQLALLGSGDAWMEQGFLAAAEHHPGRIACVIGYDEPLSHLLQGGSDAILVPSRFEPCGLTQLYGLRYGCLPIVARVGGLADTIVDANDAALADEVATGFQFTPVTAAEFGDAVERAIHLYHQPEVWATMQRRAMSRELGWPKRAREYAAIYRELVGREQEVSP